MIDYFTFSLIIAGLIVYTVFLVREMGITEQQDSFLNSVTHELKTPIASIRLYLETLQSREVGDAQRKEFYRIMLQDADRLASSDAPVTPLIPGRRRGLVSGQGEGGGGGGSSGGGNTLFERMANLSRGGKAVGADDDDGDDENDGDGGSSISIPRFLGRQNNQ